jgi:hypothetical protein
MRPCPFCEGTFPNPARFGRITCENGHTWTVEDLAFAPQLFELDEVVLCPFDEMKPCRAGCTRPDQRACVNGP